MKAKKEGRGKRPFDTIVNLPSFDEASNTIVSECPVCKQFGKMTSVIKIIKDTEKIYCLCCNSILDVEPTG